MATLKIDLQYFAGEKTEKATPQKKKESRKKGEIAKSGELPSAFIFLLMFLGFYLIGSFLADRIIALYDKILSDYLIWEVSANNVSLIFLEIINDLIWVMVPIFLIALIGAISGNLIQVGFLFTGDPIKAKLNRINPVSGFKRIFSVRALVELVKSVLKITLMGYLIYSILISHKETLLSLYLYDLHEILRFIGVLVIELGLKSAVLLFILAVFDYLYQKYDHDKKLRMSKHDIKDEYKKTEGDPQLKGKIKQKQREMSMKRMMQAIPDADVIITNPTHYAVAIVYKTGEMDAPKVIAKGMDNIALKIKEIASSHDITLVENVWLARSLYYQVEIGDAVSADLYQAVAEVLAYVYKIKGLIK